ncbi:hypothetical protein [Salinarchaeum laminariae]|uniref:hypothetical protein n=1 Tax=Salinarchaeum laminariae TaxID=869888 RepID=UPI0020BF00B6|nr:hypothetical protein [Salinarchaeum laminariae]
MALLEVETDVDEQREEMKERVPTSMADPLVAVAAGSVLLSWYEFYVKGEKLDGIFVGLWAPTMLALGSYLQQKSIVRKFKRGLASF